MEEQKKFYIGEVGISKLMPNPKSKCFYAVGTDDIMATSYLDNEEQLLGYLKALYETILGVIFVPKFPENHPFYALKQAGPLSGQTLEKMIGYFPRAFLR